MRNWAGSHEFAATTVERPRSLDELRRLVAGSRPVRPIGSTHSFHDIADAGPGGTLISVAELPGRVEVDPDRAIARVPAGMRYGDLAPVLDASGLALANLASLPHIEVGGTVATGTHGSGDHNVSLAAAVSALELVAADGDRVWIDRSDPRFDGCVVGLGALGIVTMLELDLVPTFDVAQSVYDEVPFEPWLERFDEITALGYSVSAFTQYDATLDSLWIKVRSTDPAAPLSVLGTSVRTTNRHILPGQDAAACTEQRGVPGPWYDRLPHFRLGFTPSAGEEVQTEYLLPREQAADAIRAVHALFGRVDELRDLLMIAEIRTIAADDLWLSSAYGRPTVGLHFTWHRRVPEVLAVLPQIEAELLPLGARVHWGKLFATDDPLSGYPEADRFVMLVKDFDPDGRFRGPFLDRYLG